MSYLLELRRILHAQGTSSPDNSQAGEYAQLVMLPDALLVSLSRDEWRSATRCPLNYVSDINGSEASAVRKQL